VTQIAAPLDFANELQSLPVEYALQPRAVDGYGKLEGRCIMWIILILLWLVPLSLGLVIAARMLGGLPAVSEGEWRALFRNRSDFKLSLLMGLSFTIFAVVFFFVGVLQGVVLINVGSLWLLMVPLLTGLAALALIVLWLRIGARETRMRRPIRAGVHHRSARGMLSR
jgi:hypothetical protein